MIELSGGQTDVGGEETELGRGGLNLASKFLDLKFENSRFRELRTLASFNFHGA